jgi:Restriction endonuclease
LNITAWLQSLSEKRLYVLIEDLLKAMNYKRVECIHGVGEIGKDIVFMEDTPIHRQIWRAVQVKVALTGNVRDPKHSLAAILQCEAALKNPHQTSHGQVAIEQVWLIVAHPLSDSSKRYIYSTLNDNAARVLVIDGPELADLIAEYLPGIEQPDYDTATTYIRELLAFTDSPDEFLATVFTAKFRLSSVFVNPNCAIRLMDASAIETAPAFANAVNWDALKDLPLKLEALNNGILAATHVVELRSIIGKLHEIGRAMELSRWEPLSAQTFSADLQSLSATIESIACNPVATREDLEGLNRGIDKFPFRASSAYRLRSQLPVYTTPAAIAGEACTTLPVSNFHFKSPVAALSA